MKTKEQMSKENENMNGAENSNSKSTECSLNDILFDLFLDGYELGIVSKDMKESDYIDARKEAIKKAIREVNTLK